MNQYDRKIHITTEQLADLLGVATTHLAGCISGPDAPRALFRATVNGRQQSIYDRFAAVAWVDERRTAEQQERQGRREVVPARQIRPVHEQGVYRPSPMLRMNQERAAELYGHRLITPKGIGNAHQLMHEAHQKARLS